MVGDTRAGSGTVRDRLWLWGHPAGSHTRAPGQWGLPGRSAITPAEAARSLGVPNVLMVRYEGEPRPPFAEHARPLAGLGRVVWSVEGCDRAELDAVLALRALLPNLRGVILDDYFSRLTAFPASGVLTREARAGHTLSLEALREVRRRLDAAGPPLDVWVVLYAHELGWGPLLAPHLALCDVVTLWTWQASDLVSLEESFARFEGVVGGRRKALGVYLWDYAAKQPMPLEGLARQSALGLRWLREGRIEAMIFLPSCVCDLGLESVGWARRWVAEHGDERL
jgi:hypothetical protein